MPTRCRLELAFWKREKKSLIQSEKTNGPYWRQYLKGGMTEVLWRTAVTNIIPVEEGDLKKGERCYYRNPEDGSAPNLKTENFRAEEAIWLK